MPQSLPLVTYHRHHHSFTQSSQSLQHDATKQKFVHPRLRERSLSIRCHPRAVFRRRNHSTRTTAFARLRPLRALSQCSALSAQPRRPDGSRLVARSPLVTNSRHFFGRVPFSNLRRVDISLTDRNGTYGSGDGKPLVPRVRTASATPGLLLSLPWNVSH